MESVASKRIESMAWSTCDRPKCDDRFR